MEKKSYILRSKYVFDSIKDNPFAACIIVKNGIICKIVPYEAFENDVYNNCEHIDCAEQMIMPSFVDAHGHFQTAAVDNSSYVCSDLEHCRSEEECVQVIAKFAQDHPDYNRIRGMGWFLGHWSKDELPSKYSLDEVLPDRPVYLKCADGHSMWLNSAALKEAGITANANLESGIIQTDDHGELTGMLIEPEAMEPASEKYNEFTDKELREICRQFQKNLIKKGICAVSEMSADGYTEQTAHSYALIKSMDEDGELKLNIYAYMRLFGCTDFTEYNEFKNRLFSEHFKIAGLKGFIDGVTETYTGLLLEPYTDQPHTCGEKLPLWPKNKMQKEIISANKEGIQVRLHCISDGSVRMALDMYEVSAEKNGKEDVRNSIEHIENIHPDDIPRFKQLNVIPSMQPYHMVLSEGSKVLRLGREREWPVKSIIEQGGKMAFGTDMPVVTYDPFKTIYAAMTRKNEDGKYVVQNPWETVDMSDILKAYTYGAAYVYHADREYGTLEVGKKANLIVLNKNLFNIPPKDILSTEILMHFFEGEKVYEIKERT